MELDPVIDIHVHIQLWKELLPPVLKVMTSSKADYSRYEKFVEDPGELVAYLDEIGVSRIGLINYPSPDVMGFTSKVNEFSAKYRNAYPDRFIAFGGVHPRLSKDPRGEMKKILEDLHIEAIKLHPPHQHFNSNGYRDGSTPGLAAIYEEAQSHNVPIMIHTGTSVFPGARNSHVRALDIDDVGVDFPKLKLILAHLGRPLEMDEVFFLMRRHPNFYADCSGIPPKKLLEYFPRFEELADRILFGSDWPSMGVVSIEKNVAEFRSLSLSKETKRKVLFENAAKLFKKK